jgi:hypothetical protein
VELPPDTGAADNRMVAGGVYVSGMVLLIVTAGAVQRVVIDEVLVAEAVELPKLLKATT